MALIYCVIDDMDFPEDDLLVDKSEGEILRMLEEFMKEMQNGQPEQTEKEPAGVETAPTSTKEEANHNEL